MWVTGTGEADTRTLEAFVVRRPEHERNPYGLKHLSEELFSEAFNSLEAKEYDAIKCKDGSHVGLVGCGGRVPGF